MDVGFWWLFSWFYVGCVDYFERVLKWILEGFDEVCGFLFRV